MRPFLWRMMLLFITLNVFFPWHACADDQMVIYTTNYPLTYFTERIGGEHVKVVFPAPPDVDPAFWTPDEETIRKYQQADLIVFNGGGYEKWAKKVSLPLLRIVDTSGVFKDDLIEIDTTVTHSHGPAGDHSHGGTAFTTWLDFSQAAKQAGAIYNSLSRKQPTRKTEFAHNYKTLIEDLLELDKQMKDLTAAKPGLPLIASHPIYQYLARRYKMNLQMVMWEPDTPPEEQQWQRLQNLLNIHHAAWMIWEDQPLTESINRLEEMNIKTQVFSPCFNRPEKGDFLSTMQQNVKNIELVYDYTPEVKFTQCSKPRPQVCTMDYQPVCAQMDDGSFKTYSNGCTACSDVNVVAYRDGECN